MENTTGSVETQFKQKKKQADRILLEMRFQSIAYANVPTHIYSKPENNRI